MAGQGQRRVRECIKRNGWAFRDRPKISMGLEWCRLCGYQVKLHRRIAMAEHAEPR